MVCLLRSNSDREFFTPHRMGKQHTYQKPKTWIQFAVMLVFADVCCANVWSQVAKHKITPLNATRHYVRVNRTVFTNVSANFTKDVAAESLSNHEDAVRNARMAKVIISGYIFLVCTTLWIIWMVVTHVMTKKKLEQFEIKAKNSGKIAFEENSDML